MESDPTKKSENNDFGSQWDILAQESITPQVGELKTKASAGTLIEEYGDRVIYTDENGAETRMTLNPWAMAQNVLKSPEDMLLTGQVFEHMAKKWGDNDRNPSRKVMERENGQIEEIGWDEAIRPSGDSILGRWIKQNLEPDMDGNKMEQVASAVTLIENYGDRIIYTDGGGKETRMTLNPWAMMEDALDNPDTMSLVGTAFRHMANKWHNDEKNPSRRVEVNSNGERIETGWENAIRVDDSKKIGRYINEKLKQSEN
ncbi:hypothetical protein IKF34_01255 [Candidatus Saccharibacteria bacterium]|nr:hypothetical protein [Candidatus Saccharibacteria bacterium]